MTSDQEQLVIIVDRLTQAVNALEAKVDAEVKALDLRAEADRELVKTLVKQIERTRKSDRAQQQEIGWIKRIMLSVILLIGGGFLAGNQLDKLGEENIANLLEIGVYLIGGSVAVTASQRNYPNEMEPEDEDNK